MAQQAEAARPLPEPKPKPEDPEPPPSGPWWKTASLEMGVSENKGYPFFEVLIIAILLFKAKVL